MGRPLGDINIKIKELYDYKHDERLSFEMEEFERVKARYDIQSNQMAPFDQSEYIQSLFIPRSDDADPVLMTVQVVNPMLREYSSERAEELKNKSRECHKKNRCPKGKKLIETFVAEKSDDKPSEGV